MNLTIIYEDKDILVCFKPAGVPTQTASLTIQDVVSMVKSYLVKKEGKASSYLGLVHRLDQPVSGLLVLAKNKKAASLTITKKQYYALCMGTPVEKEGELRHYLWKNPKTSMAEVVDEKNAGNKTEVKESVLTYQTEEERNEIQEKSVSLLKVSLKTGRFHQIRAQFSAIGHPLLGDLKYGTEDSKQLSTEMGIKMVALCAAYLKIIHPVTKKEMEFQLKEELLPAWAAIIRKER